MASLGGRSNGEQQKVAARERMEAVARLRAVVGIEKSGRACDQDEFFPIHSEADLGSRTARRPVRVAFAPGRWLNLIAIIVGQPCSSSGRGLAKITKWATGLPTPENPHICLRNHRLDAERTCEDVVMGAEKARIWRTASGCGVDVLTEMSVSRVAQARAV